MHGRTAERLVELAAPAAGEACLDVGCGTGLVTNLVAQRVGLTGSVIGVDVSARMLALAEQRARSARLPSVQFRRANADEPLPFGDRSFDLVTFGDSLPYLRDPQRALERARRWLRPGGRIAVSVRRRSLQTTAQQLFFDRLRELARENRRLIRPAGDGRAALGEPDMIRDFLIDLGFEEPLITGLVTGLRLPSAAAWVDLMVGVGPWPWAVLSGLGPGALRALEEWVERAMRGLGDEAFLYHEAFTFAIVSVAPHAPGRPAQRMNPRTPAYDDSRWSTTPSPR
jgi:ubiquinone/menaquinone biosynthesis C-methylase UbiE